MCRTSVFLVPDVGTIFASASLTASYGYTHAKNRGSAETKTNNNFDEKSASTTLNRATADNNGNLPFKHALSLLFLLCLKRIPDPNKWRTDLEVYAAETRPLQIQS